MNLNIIENLKKEIEEKFNNPLKKEINENLRKLKNNDCKIPLECHNLFFQAYQTLQSVEFLIEKSFFVDANALLRTSFENIITSTMIALDREIYSEFKNMTLKNEERKFSIQRLRNLFKNRLHEIEPELFGEFSNRFLQILLDELYNKLCNFTHGGLVVNVAVEMSMNHDEDLLEYSVKSTIAFLKLLLNSCLKYFAKNETNVIYEYFGLLQIIILNEINVEKYSDGHLNKYREMMYLDINGSLFEQDSKNIEKFKKEYDKMLEEIQY